MNSTQNFIQLSRDTAPAARGALPLFSPPPRAHLARGMTATALERFQAHAFTLVDAHTNSALTRCASIAAFADAVCDVDNQLSAAIRRAGDV